MLLLFEWIAHSSSKPYKKLKKINIEFDDAEIEEYEFDQYISFISIKI